MCMYRVLKIFGKVWPIKYLSVNTLNTLNALYLLEDGDTTGCAKIAVIDA